MMWVRRELRMSQNWGRPVMRSVGIRFLWFNLTLEGTFENLESISAAPQDRYLSQRSNTNVALRRLLNVLIQASYFHFV